MKKFVNYEILGKYEHHNGSTVVVVGIKGKAICTMTLQDYKEIMKLQNKL